jgi:hypothetical protein
MACWWTARCLVIEGSVAGATAWAYCPNPEQGPALRAVGVSHLFGHMADLPELLTRR